MNFSKIIQATVTALVVFAPVQQTLAQTISSGDLGIGLIVAEDPQLQVLNLYKVNSGGSATLLQSNIFPDRTLNTFQAANSIVDTASGKIYLREPDQGQGPRYRIYNAATNSFEGYTALSNLPAGSVPQFLTAPLQLDKIARREGNELHIGENSFITRELGGKQEIYARDANDNPIPLNVTNGSDLQINGVSLNGAIQTLDGKVTTNTSNIQTLDGKVTTNTSNIQTLDGKVTTNTANINNLGSGVAGATALSTALSALPTLSDDTPYSCGVGTGAYSSRYAMGFGCAARVTERLAFNAGGSVVFGGSSDYGGGSLDNVAGRLGFVFKIGKITPTSNQAISKRAEKLEEQLNDVKQENQKLTGYLAEMKNLIAMQNDRLMNLEKIASVPGGSLSSVRVNSQPGIKLASYKR
jgi:hypothetical protein